MNPRDLITPWHEGYQHVSEKTQVYYIGEHIVLLEHQCPAKNVGQPPPKATRLQMFQPTHYAKAAAYCQKCDTLYIGDNQNVREETPAG